MIKKITLLFCAAALFASCVSKKVYNDLESKYAGLKKENRHLLDQIDSLGMAKAQSETENVNLQGEIDRLTAERDKVKADLSASEKNMKTLQASYTALENNSNDALEANMKKNRDLLALLEAKEKALAAERSQLDASSKRLNELESTIAAKDASMKKLKETLSKALNSFEGKGLTVQMKNGKVYVSMENKLLFGSGSWAVGVEGRKAVVEVGKVLAANPDISVLIEGHTDNDEYVATGPIADNWDLSTKRATAIVTILGENKGISKFNLTAAGRSEYAPVASNSSAEGKSKNRRIEIILTPKLDEISKMLNEL
ncbi:MAG: cell envelope biogenesis protein OmpA [Flavobacterium sp.]|nr:MAG: cell envelope biogenesis protein OmpA [Flavobacterium sp.]